MCLTVRHIFYIYRKPQSKPKGGMTCILPMAIIGPLKASCGTSLAAITTTAAQTARSRNAGAAAATDRTAGIGTASTPNVPLPQAA